MSDFQYTRILQAVIETPWAILPSKAAIIQDLLLFRAHGGRLTQEEIQARLEAERPHIEAANGRSRARGGAVAVLPLVGTIIPRAGSLMEMSGAISTERFGRAFQAALNDPDVASIVIDIDSPGGQVSGVPELAREIYKGRGVKPITAVANHLAASAAYWIGSAANELVITPSGEVGSIGVLAMHQDFSGMLEQEGVGVEFVYQGKYKIEGNPYGPLEEEARAAIQGRVDEYYQMFTGDVARHRGVKRSDVVDGFGEGRVVGAKTAVSLGMADRIGTLDETIGRLAKSSRRHNTSAEYGRRRLRAVLAGGSVETAD